jgi:hypothetical protein
VGFIALPVVRQTKELADATIESSSLTIVS